mmetsp:Transcript_44841/g.71975  ORF Transcript_44841/g.71975 Transcript_44841/m.71975 type:complete len:257 (+) Transcript_44841:582-1352(+)
MLAADARKLKGGLHHAVGGVAVAGQRARAEGTVVGADAHGDAILLTLEHQRREDLLDFVQLGVVLRIRLIQDVFKFLTPIGEVARVDADFIEALCDGQSHLGREVNIGDEGGGVAICHEPPLDLRTRLGLHHALHRDAHHLRPGISALLHLGDGSFNVAGVGGGHGLADDGVLAAQLHVPHHHSPGGAAERLVVRLAVQALGQQQLAVNRGRHLLDVDLALGGGRGHQQGGARARMRVGAARRGASARCLLPCPAD